MRFDGTIDRFKRKNKPVVSEEKLFVNSLVGYGGAAMLSRSAAAPLDRVKTLLQCRPVIASSLALVLSQPTPLSTILALRRHQGWTSYWWGFGPQVCSSVAGTASRLLIHSKLRLYLMPGGEHRYQAGERLFKEWLIFTAAGMTSLMLFYPLDVTRTRLACDPGLPQQHHRRVLRGFWHASWQSLRAEGVSSLYSGIGLGFLTAPLFLLVATPMTSLMRVWMGEKQHEGQSSLSSELLSDDRLKAYREESLRAYPYNVFIGATAGLAAQSVTYPLDTIRRRYQVAAGPDSRGARYANIRQCIREAMARPVRELYGGFGWNLARTVPETFLFCTLYYALKLQTPV